MRKLMMGCIPGVRTLVNTTEEHTSLQRMDTPITMKVGASYSISWTGAMPTTGDYIYPFKVYGGYDVVSNMCNIRLKKKDIRNSYIRHLIWQNSWQYRHEFERHGHV